MQNAFEFQVKEEERKFHLGELEGTNITLRGENKYVTKTMSSENFPDVKQKLWRHVEGQAKCFCNISPLIHAITPPMLRP